MTYDSLKTITLKLLAYCQANNWAGYDPYDALNSEIFKALPFLDFRLFRLGFTQVMKGFPLNLRPLLFVPKTQNPKAIALFLMAFLKLERLGLLDNKDLITLMTQKLINLRSPSNLINASNPNNLSNSTNNYWCWGYNFDWQTRGELFPKLAPNIICTTFAANALLDLFERYPKQEYLDMAVSAGRFLLFGLNITKEDSGLCFSYTQRDHSQVHNANLLGAALLSRLYSFTGEKAFFDFALQAARFSIRRQNADGSWFYGELPTQRWVDNFHTGYTLCALRSISQCTGTAEFDSQIRRGFEFYRKHFFRKDGAPKYFHDRVYPIDIHNVAQSIITPLALKDLDESSAALGFSVFSWAMTHMWDEKGYFYYQVLPFCKIKIPYMRWSQAWMLLALSTLLQNYDRNTDTSPSEAKQLQ